MRAYLDHAASTPILDCARAAMMKALDHTGNAASLHSAGRVSRRVLEESRELVAERLGVEASEIVFTSGGTEADNLAVKGLWWSRTRQDPQRNRVLVSRVEHHAVMDAVLWLAEHGAEVAWIEVDDAGVVDLEQITDELETRSAEIALVAVMAANNEVGTVQPLSAVAQACETAGVPLHVDAVQAVGAIPIDVRMSTTMAISAHKLGGPIGVGALVVRRGTDLVALTHGGGQEGGVRSGSVQVPAIAGFAAAVDSAVSGLPEQERWMAQLRDRLIAGVLREIPGAQVNGAGRTEDRLPGIAHMSFPGCEGDALLMLLDAAGVDVSIGSACTAGVPQPSHVLLAMGMDPALARSSLRFSLGTTSTEADVEHLLRVLPAAHSRAQRAGRARNVARPNASLEVAR